MAVKIFCSYADKDEKFLEELKEHLRPLINSSLIEWWYDRNISVGTEWQYAIDVHLNTAEIILLLISQYFMDSDYAYTLEATRALERHKYGEARVIPILLRPIYYGRAPFAQLQALPIDALPVTSWKNRDEAFIKIAKDLQNSLKAKEEWPKESDALSNLAEIYQVQGYYEQTEPLLKHVRKNALVNKVQEFFTRVKFHGLLIFDLLQLSSSVIGIIAASISISFVSWLLNLQEWLILIITFSSGLLLTLIITAFKQKQSSRKKGYKHLKTEALYEIDNDDPKHHTLTTVTKIQAIENKVREYEDTYLWTGQGEEKRIRVISPGHTLSEKFIDETGWFHYRIALGHELKIGETVVIKTIQEFYDTENKFRPFFARTILQPTDHIALQVALPLRFPHKIIFYEWDTDGPARNMIGKEIVEISDRDIELKWKAKGIQGEIEIRGRKIYWQVKRPKQGHKYEIYWQY